jgi:hypothetical protein
VPARSRYALSEDRNSTWAVAFAGTNDRINPVNGVVVNAPRNTLDFLIGVTQALSSNSIVQSNVTFRVAMAIIRPVQTARHAAGSPTVFAWLTRQSVSSGGGCDACGFPTDICTILFGSNSSALEATWYQPLPDEWSIAPGLRYYTQSAADFYFDPPFPQGYVAGQDYTADTRLSAFGAFTPSIAIARSFADGWRAGLKVAFYRQRASWRLAGNGSPGLEPFSARWIEAGISRSF